MRKGEAKPVVKRLEELARKRHESIADKCHPALFELGPLWKESILALRSLGHTPPPELLAEIMAKLDTGLREIHRRYSGPVSPAPDTFAAQVIWKDAVHVSDEHGVTEWLHFQRHGVPLKVDHEKARQRNWDACRRVLRTHSDLARLYCGERIKPFKSNLEHSSMFQTLWGFGIEKLTPEELADLFDKFCPCGIEDAHDPDALRKQRTRFQRRFPSTQPDSLSAQNFSEHLRVNDLVMC